LAVDEFFLIKQERLQKGNWLSTIWTFAGFKWSTFNYVLLCII